MTGKLSLLAGQPAWASILQNGRTCYKLALPDDFYDQASRWDGKVVNVRGDAFEQSDQNDPDQVLMWFEYRGRRMSMGACDHGTAIYVTEIAGAQRRLSWPATHTAP